MQTKQNKDGKRELTKFQKLFFLTYSNKKDGFSAILFAIDFFTIPLNIIVLTLTNWRKRLI